MFKYICVMAIFASSTVFASSIDEGTYVGSRGKRANISEYQDQGINQYELVLTQSGNGNFNKFHLSSRNPISLNNPYITGLNY